jgi:nicotinate-nucleotide adenylyltransferase
MKTLIFGGAFDPPHHGHINLVKSVQSQVKPDRTLIIPTGNAPHKRTQTNFTTRFMLAKAAFADCGENCEVSDIENNPRLSYTVDTLRELRRLCPDDELVLAVGSDSYESLGDWHESAEITKLCEVVSVSRDIIKVSSGQIREQFKPKRYLHSLNVAIMCGGLARHHEFSPESSEKAYIAGLYHDIGKLGEKQRTVPPTEYNPTPEEIAHFKLWHGIFGAVYVRDVFGISDAEIIDAIRWHTIGRENMSDVEKVVFIADKISLERGYDGVEELRKLAFCNLDSAINEYNKQRRSNYE